MRDLREHRVPADGEELADFETDVLAGFVLARASAGLADSTIRNDTNHLELTVAAVGRKSLADLVSSLTSGRLRVALVELATLPRAAVVVEDRYSQVFTHDRVRPATVADGLAELQIRYPTIPIVFCETRKLAEEWTYYLDAHPR